MLMLVFEWNSMRVGDRVMVHDDHDAGLALQPGTVRFVQTREQSANEVTIRLDGDPSRVVSPRRHAVHMLPIDRRFLCWRCDVIAVATTEQTEQRAAA